MRKFKPPSVEEVERACEQAPEWTCPVCGAKIKRLPSPRWAMRGGSLSYLLGRCEACEAKKKALEERQRQKLQAQELIRASSLPSRFVAEADLKITDADLFAKLDALEVDKRWVYLWGANSTGKSTQIGRTIRRLVRKGVACYYINEVDFFGAIKASWDKAGESQNDLLSKVKSAQVLFWDEFCWYDNRSGWRADIVYNILENFETHDKLVVFAGRTQDKQLPSKLNLDHLHRLKRKRLRCLRLINKPFF